ncbi:MAG: Gfo/Idh/MocA family oxidoreductase [Chitinophagaceae bacterium]|nr:MAG: Gfo/Idh/MocA family oxidoreductase [Chitinophagaceae bacterium]
MEQRSRRQFLSTLSQGLAISTFGMQGIVTFSSCATEEKKEERQEEKAATNAAKNAHKLGIALVGLGKYSSGQLGPALKETENCYLAGIVTGTPSKIPEWKQKYKLAEKNIYNYDNFDTIRDNPDIDIIYIVLPNAMHAEYVVRAAEAGKHVICEKPMAITVAECDRMIAACKKAGKQLSIGYRLHFEPHNQEMMRLTREKVYGNLKKVFANDGMAEVEGWRLNKELSGGGPLMDVGIYCVQGARYVTGMEPIAVIAKEGQKTKPELFTNIEESLTWQMEFPGGLIADCKTSYTEDMNLLRAEADKGWYELTPAYAYRGIDGRTSDGRMNFPEVYQQARQMDDFADCIINGRKTQVPGEMGRQDVKILQAIYQSMKTGKRVAISK